MLEGFAGFLWEIMASWPNLIHRDFCGFPGPGKGFRVQGLGFKV